MSSQNAQKEAPERFADDDISLYGLPPESGTCTACFNTRYWQPRRGFMAIYCGYCSDRRLPQPSVFNFNKKNPCKAFRPYPEKWDPEEQTVRAKEMPYGALRYGVDRYIPTGDEPLPPEESGKP